MHSDEGNINRKERFSRAAFFFFWFVLPAVMDVVQNKTV